MPQKYHAFFEVVFLFAVKSQKYHSFGWDLVFLIENSLQKYHVGFLARFVFQKYHFSKVKMVFLRCFAKVFRAAVHLRWHSQKEAAGMNRPLGIFAYQSQNCFRYLRVLMSWQV